VVSIFSIVINWFSKLKKIIIGFVIGLLFLKMKEPLLNVYIIIKNEIFIGFQFIANYFKL
jgi:hypothetical protein